MRPRHFCLGRHCTGELVCLDCRASMRPRHFCLGRPAPSTASSPTHRWGFNEAQAFLPGKTEPLDEGRATNDELQ